MVENPCANAGDARDLGLIPGSGRSPGEGNGNPLQYYCLENSMDRGPWRAVVYRDTTGDTRLTACIGVVLDFHIYKHTWEVGIPGSVPDHHNKENTEIKHITQIFWFPSAYKIYVYTTLLSNKCTTALCLLKKVCTLIKNTLLLKKGRQKEKRETEDEIVA